ncbi:SRPBCC family protein [Methylocystis parvus]|uniref:SRPBCC family protein n=1 Tax=Methylocystis parvus TaxID=134 RepID=UPI003C74FD6F
MFGLGTGLAPSVKGSASVAVSQTVDKVYAFVVSDFFSNYQKWAPQVVELEPKGPTPVRPGIRARQVTLDRGMRSESTFEVSAVEPPKRLVIEGLSESFRSTYHFEEVSAEETEVTFEFEMRELDLSMRPFAKLIGMALQEGAEQTIENLKTLLEKSPACARRARAS